MKLLVVEDEALLRHHLYTRLTDSGHVVEAVANAEEALYQTGQFNHDLAIIDLGLPGMGGLDLIRQLRAQDKTFPILILTARGNWQDKVEGLAAGADDYVVKPFQFDELLARVRAVSRRSQGRVLPALCFRDVKLDPAKRLVTRAGQRVALSAHEYRTLLALMERPGQVITRDTLEDAVYGADSSIESNTIAVFIHQLRRKLGEDIVITVHGHGYMIGEADR